MSTRFSMARCSAQVMVVATAVVLAACAGAPTVRVNVAPGADLASYKTFGFVNPLGTDRAGYRSIVSQQLIIDTQRELEARGMTRSDAPQLLVNFSANLTKELQVTPSPPTFVGGYYGYRGGMYSTWPMYQPDTVTQYTQGTLNIDMVDAGHKQLVWEGVVTDSVSQSDLDNLSVALNKAVVAAFAKFPILPVAK